MDVQKKKQLQGKRRAFRVRNKFTRRGEKLRISVNRSLNNIYVQIIDDVQGITKLSCSTVVLDLQKKQDKKEAAFLVGKQLGEKALQEGLENVFFDRGKYSYHGRIQALAEGIRDAGLKF